MRFLFLFVLVVVGSVTRIEAACAEERRSPPFDPTYRSASEPAVLVAQDSLLRPYRSRSRRRNWELVIAPYAWLASAQGTAYADGVGEDFEIPVADSIEKTNFGYQLITEFRWKRWFAFADITRALLRDGNEGRVASVDVRVEQWIVEFAAGYRVLGPTHIEQRRCCPTLDLFVGGRYQSTEVEVSVDTPIGGFSSGGSDDWVDPFVGFRTWSPIKGRLGFTFRGDVGGFSIGSGSRFAWQAWALLTWRIAKRWQLGVGYRVSFYDRITGSGANRNGTELYQYGPMIGVQFVL